jgi:hypothetical protein
MPGGRHQIGIPAGFKSESVAGFLLECLAGFIGIRSHDAKRKRYGPLIAVSGIVSLVSAPGLDRNHPIKSRTLYY